MGQKVNPIAVRLNLNRFSDSSWFSDYYYSTLLYQDLNFREYLSSIKQPNANKLGFRSAKCIIHHFPKRSFFHLFCLSDPRKKLPIGEPSGTSRTLDRVAICAARLVKEQRNLTFPSEVGSASGARIWTSLRTIAGVAFGGRSRYNAPKGSGRIRQDASILQKKRAATRLYRLLSDESLSQVYCSPSEQKLARLRARCSSFSGWFRKDRAKRYQFFRIRLVRSLQSIMQSQNPTGPHVPNGSEITMLRQQPKSQSHSGVSKWSRVGLLTDVLSRVPEDRLYPGHHSERAVRTSVGLRQLCRPSYPGGPSVRTQPVLRQSGQVGEPADKVACTGALADPFRDTLLPRRLPSMEGAQLGWLRCFEKNIRQEFNFYAIHYYFMQKMGESLGRLPLSFAPNCASSAPCEPDLYSSDLCGPEDALRDLQRNERLRSPIGPFPKRFPRNGPPSGEEPLGFRTAKRVAYTSRTSYLITRSLDFYLSNVHAVLSQKTKTSISLRPIKVHSVFQCASLVAQEVACKLEQKKSFRLICRLIFQQLTDCNYIKGIRINCSGRLNGAEIAKTECRKFGETSLHVFSDKIDYAHTKASTAYGILGVKVWISYI